MAKLNNLVTELMHIDTVNDVALDPQGIAYDALHDPQVVEVLTDSNLPLNEQLDALDATLDMIRKSA